ncbi:MAG TPA: AmiS/UreI family transporter, partial [Mycobacterium sp.]
PTAMLLQANGDAATILSASGLYLFGFTYLYVGINNLAGLEPQGLGWFSLFVAVAAVAYAALSFGSHDPVFGVIWLSWAALWFLFFLVLGLGRDSLTRFTGWSATLLGVPTCCVPAFLLLTGHYQSSIPIAAATAALLVALLVVARILSSSSTSSHFGALPAFR